MGFDEKGAQIELNTRLIKSYLASFSAARPDDVLEHVHTEFENIHLGVLAQGCSGKVVYAKRLGDFLGAFIDIKYDILDVVADEKKGSCRYQFRFKQNQQSFKVNGMMWFEFKGGLISRRIDCWDGLDYLKQAHSSAEMIEKIIS